MKKILILLLVLLLSICHAQTPKITQDRLREYKTDISNVLNNILYEKMHNDKTCPQIIEELYKTSELSYNKILIEKNNPQAEQLIKNSFAIISTLPEDICEKFNNILYNKYNLDYYDDYINQNTTCQFYIAQNFLKPYKIKNTKKYINFIKTIDLYLQKLYEMQVELGLL